MCFGEIVKSKRLELKKSLKDVATETGVSYFELYNIENYHNIPRAKWFLALVNYYNLDYDEMYKITYENKK